MCHTPQGSGMSRINHLQRRDGRYWVNIRFDAFRNSGEHRKHIRFSLRTSDLRVAQFRLASIMLRILEFRIDPDRRRAATRLQNWMLDFMEHCVSPRRGEQATATKGGSRLDGYNSPCASSSETK